MAPCMMYSYRKIEDRFTRDTATRLVALRYQIPRDVRYMLRQLCRLHSRRGERKIPGGQPYDRPRCTISHMTKRPFYGNRAHCAALLPRTGVVSSGRSLRHGSARGAVNRPGGSTSTSARPRWQSDVPIESTAASMRYSLRLNCGSTDFSPKRGRGFSGAAEIVLHPPE